MDRMTMQLVL